MGACASRQQRKADEAMAKTSEFVRFAMLGDIENVKRMLIEKKTNSNTQDVSQALDDAKHALTLCLL